MGFARDDNSKEVEEAGLQDIVVDCVGENCCASSSCGSERAKISIFMASGKK